MIVVRYGLLDMRKNEWLDKNYQIWRIDCKVWIVRCGLLDM